MTEADLLRENAELRRELAEAKTQRDLAQKFQAGTWKVTTPCEPGVAIRTIQDAARAEEREACALIADHYGRRNSQTGVWVARDIRNRGNGGEAK